MPEPPRVRVDVVLTAEDARALMIEEVRAGFAARPREIPSKYFYDDRGGALFEEITRLPEYYLTRAESALLEEHAEGILTLTRPRELVELGPGSPRKTRILIEAGIEVGTLERYVPLDVSREAAERTGRDLLSRHPSLSVHAVVGDFERHLERLPVTGRPLVAFLGSTIGNFVRPRAEALLERVASLLGKDGWFLLGTDLVKDRATLEAAYDDTRGITAEFNRNALRVLNRGLDADFVPERFEHVAFYDEQRERIEMHLQARGPQHVRLGALGLDLKIEDGERIRTEVSCKYTRASVEAMLGAAGLRLARWIDDGRFALSLAARS